MVYIPNAVASGDGTENLSPIGTSGEAVHLTLASAVTGKAETTVAVNNQGLVGLIEAAVTELEGTSPICWRLLTMPMDRAR